MPPDPNNSYGNVYLPYSLGLSGIWRLIANASAVALLFIILIYGVFYLVPKVQRDFHDQLLEERRLFREVLDRQEVRHREDMRDLVQRLERISMALEELTRRLDRTLTRPSSKPNE